MPEQIPTRALQAIADRVFPGCVIGVVRKTGERTILPFGTLRYGDAERVTEGTVYDLASVTKSIPVASIALTFITEGKLRLDDKLISFVPEFSGKWREEVTVEHLLRYQVAGVRLSMLKDKTPDEIFDYAYSRLPAEALAEAGELAYKPGERSVYTNLPALLLGVVLERAGLPAEASAQAGGAPLDALAKRMFFEPLGMRRTTFFPNVADCAPTEIGEDGREVCGIVHDESARVFARAQKAVGHAGLFSTVGDLLNFLEALLQGRFPAVVDGAHKGLGWQVNDPKFMGIQASPHTFGKTGFTGTSVVCDTERGIAFVVLSNRTYPKRPADDSAINAFRRELADIVFSGAR